MEHRSGLLVHATVTPADGHGERAAAREMITAVAHGRRVTLAADKGYDTQDFIADLRALHVTPHVAAHTTGRRSAIDGRTTRHPGYAVSQRKRKLVEQGFGWMKTVGGLRKLRHRGQRLVTWVFTFTAAAYNIVRLRRLLAVTARRRGASGGARADVATGLAPLPGERAALAEYYFSSLLDSTTKVPGLKAELRADPCLITEPVLVDEVRRMLA